MESSKDSLLYLANKLHELGGNECLDAAQLVLSASKDGNALGCCRVQSLLYGAVAELLSQALDHDSYLPSRHNDVSALFMEMQGRVLHYRLLRGLLVRSTSASADNETIYDILGV